MIKWTKWTRKSAKFHIPIGTKNQKSLYNGRYIYRKWPVTKCKCLFNLFYNNTKNLKIQCTKIAWLRTPRNSLWHLFYSFSLSFIHCPAETLCVCFAYIHHSYTSITWNNVTVAWIMLAIYTNRYFLDTQKHYTQGKC